MPHTIPACPQCGLENTYPDGDHFVCPDCAFEWPQAAAGAEDEAAGDGSVKDANGNLLNQIDYSVAGRGNTSRSLERNAELQLRLDKRSYASGEEIAHGHAHGEGGHHHH